MTQSTIVITGVGPKVDGLEWESENLLRIGRQSNLEVVLRDHSVEQLHAEVKNQGHRWVVRDLASHMLFPTLLNGIRVNGKEQELKPDDVLQVGKLFLRVARIRSHKDAPTPPVPPRNKSGSEQDVQPTVQVNVGGLGRGKAEVPAGLIESRADFELPPLAEAIVPIPPVPPKPTTQPAPVPVREKLLLSTPDLQLHVTASTQHSWDEALNFVTDSDSKPLHSQAVRTVLRANHHLSQCSSLDELLSHIVDDTLAALGAQRCAILLFDETTGELKLHRVHAPNVKTRRKGYSRTLAHRCFERGESVLCQDIRLDQELTDVTSVQHGSMSSVICAMLRSPRKRVGVLHLDRGPFQEPFSESEMYLADAVAASVSVGIECAQLVELQRDQFVQTVTTLARAVEMRDQYTGDHTKRVTDYSLILAEELKLPVLEKFQIQVGAPLHDIGKIGIDDSVLRKPGKLTTSEFEHMMGHTVKGAEILQHITGLAPMLPIIRHHHERWDGTGYPDRLGREHIALTARIVAVADAFDAMTSHRPYRPAMPTQLAYLELLSKAGTHFDPRCVQAFLKVRTRVESAMKANG